ncbi:MAG: GTPase KRas precursor [Candidatus Heimdallarchaeota archaeon LC_3]|nr:MAG: GTPase KRas precursor [Candidatus Heimdallarchaeota archaeon LC_3]
MYEIDNQGELPTLNRLTGKIVLCGDGGVGKTSLRKAYLGQEFNSNYLETLGADFATKIIKILYDKEEFQIKYLIWDLAGQPNFNSVRTNYFKGSHAILIIYDVTNKKSYENVLNWIEEIKKSLSREGIPPISLLGNKIDLVNEKTVDDYITPSEGIKLSEQISSNYFDQKIDIPYIETSAKTGENVEKAFQILSRQLVKNYLDNIDE